MCFESTIGVYLTMESQERLNGVITRRLTRTISFDDAYLALLPDDFDRKSDQVGEDRKPLSAVLAEFEPGMHHQCIFQPHRVVDAG